MMASMIASFFGKGKDSSRLFAQLKVRRKGEALKRHQNRHNVIFISLNEIPQNCCSYQSYIERIERRLRNDLRKAFPRVEISEEEAVWDALSDIYESEEEARFLFVLDEWDYIFHREFITETDKKAYIDFLSNLSCFAGIIPRKCCRRMSRERDCVSGMTDITPSPENAFIIRVRWWRL